MTDDVDRAQAQEERYRADAIARRKPELKPLGYCHWCSSGIGGGDLYCSKECRDDHEKQFDADRRNGR